MGDTGSIEIIIPNKNLFEIIESHDGKRKRKSVRPGWSKALHDEISKACGKKSFWRFKQANVRKDDVLVNGNCADCNGKIVVSMSRATHNITVNIKCDVSVEHSGTKKRWFLQNQSSSSSSGDEPNWSIQNQVIGESSQDQDIGVVSEVNATDEPNLSKDDQDSGHGSNLSFSDVNSIIDAAHLSTQGQDIGNGSNLLFSTGKGTSVSELSIKAQGAEAGSHSVVSGLDSTNPIFKYDPLRTATEAFTQIYKLAYDDDKVIHKFIDEMFSTSKASTGFSSVALIEKCLSCKLESKSFSAFFKLEENINLKKDCSNCGTENKIKKVYNKIIVLEVDNFDIKGRIRDIKNVLEIESIIYDLYAVVERKPVENGEHDERIAHVNSSVGWKTQKLYSGFVPAQEELDRELKLIEFIFYKRKFPVKNYDSVFKM